MVCLNKLTILARTSQLDLRPQFKLIKSVGTSALAATIHHERRSVFLEDADAATAFRREDNLFGVLEGRQGNKKPDSPEMQKLKDERKAISPELAKAKDDMKAAQKAIDDAIPKDLKTKEDQAFQVMKAARKAAHDAIPQDLKTKEQQSRMDFKTAQKASDDAIPKDLLQREDVAATKIDTVFNALSDKKEQLRTNRVAMQAAHKGQGSSPSASPPSPSGAVPPSPSPSRAT